MFERCCVEHGPTPTQAMLCSQRGEALLDEHVLRRGGD
jgi:hypothetical protein